jgi:hypothetical protein
MLPSRTRWHHLTVDCREARLYIAGKLPSVFKGWRVRSVVKKNRCARRIQGLYRTRKARKLANSFRAAKMNQCVQRRRPCLFPPLPHST